MASTKIIADDPKQIAKSVSEYATLPPGTSFKVICIQPELDSNRVNTWFSGEPLICATRNGLTQMI